MADVIGFGEAMVRLTPPHFQRVEQARSFDVEFGGAELNTLTGLARLGRNAAWVSRLPDNSLGRLIVNRVREAGVDDRFVTLSPEGRCGLYFLEFGANPRPSEILYDRKGSTFSLSREGDFDWPAILEGAKWFHGTGITAALGPNVAMEMKRALTVCRERNIPVTIDLNYRSKLWTTIEAGRVMSGLLPLATLLIASESDAKQLFGIEGADFPAVADQLQQRFGIPAVACFRRSGTAGWRDRVSAVLRHQTNLLETEWYDVEVVDRLGAGDAFAAGLIDGFLEGDPWRGLEWGTAMGALKHTIPGDLPILTRADVEGVLSGQGMRIRR